MGSKKLVWCCIIGIVLGFLAPFVLKTNQQTSLMIGMAGGLGLGYLLEMLDEKRGKAADQKVITEKAAQAGRMLEHARAELHGDAIPEEEQDAEEYLPEDLPDLTAEEQSAKLSEAEEMIRKARERIK